MKFLLDSNEMMWKDASWKPLAIVSNPIINVNERTKLEFNIGENVSSINSKICIEDIVIELGPYVTHESETLKYLFLAPKLICVIGKSCGKILDSLNSIFSRHC